VIQRFVILLIPHGHLLLLHLDGCLIFNDDAAGDPAVCAIAFGGDKTVTSGTFTIEFPAASAATAIIGIA
jgi:hypothetical protein